MSVRELVNVEATGELGKVEALLEVLEPFGIKEIVQSGTVAIGRGRSPSPTAPCAADRPRTPSGPARAAASVRYSRSIWWNVRHLNK